MFYKSIKDKGVSPVVGVMLMVSLTVIISSIVGVYFLTKANELGSGDPVAGVSVT